MIQGAIKSRERQLEHPQVIAFVYVEPPETNLLFPALHQLTRNFLGVRQGVLTVRQVHTAIVYNRGGPLL